MLKNFWLLISEILKEPLIYKEVVKRVERSGEVQWKARRN